MFSNSTKGQFTFCTSDYFDCQGVRTVILTFLLPHDCKLSCHKIELMKSYLCSIWVKMTYLQKINNGKKGLHNEILQDSEIGWK